MTSIHRSPIAGALLLLLLAPSVGVAGGAELPPGGSEQLTQRIADMLGRAGGLTADVVARRASATSYDVAARKADVDAAVAALNQSIVGFVPRVSGLVRYQRLSHVDGLRFGSFTIEFPDNATTVQASLTVPISDYVFRLAQNYAAARHTRQSAELQQQAAELKAATDAKVLYYTWARARLQVLVAEQALAQARGHLVDVQHQFEAGAVSRADVLRVESQEASSELLVEKARNLQSVSEEQLRVAMHDSGDAAAYQIGEDLYAPLDTALANDKPNDLYAEAVGSRLEVRAFTESRDAVRKQSSAARAGYYPVIAAIGDVVYANPNQRIFPPRDQFDFTWDVGVQASWSPNDVATADAASKNVAARARTVDAQKMQFEDGLRNELMMTHATLRETLVALSTTQRGLKAAEESYRVRRELFVNGRATSVELTDAETDLTRTRFDAINARIDLRIARVRLQHALGRDVTDAAKKNL